MINKVITTGLVLASFLYASPSFARDRILIVGSSTVFPFTTAVAEQFGQSSDFKTPVVEATGTGGGMKLFCSGTGENTPDFTNASRRIKRSELETCQKNGVSPVEIQVGFDGIVIANSKSAERFQLSLAQLFLALAKKIPHNGKLIDNPNKKWSDIDPTLPDTKIEILGPPPTSGTRDAFVELAMEGGCKAIEGAKMLGLKKKACHIIREDGHFVEAGENDNLIVQKLDANPNALGIFGYSFLEQNSSKIQSTLIGGIEPSFEVISSGEYPISRSLYVYAKKEHATVIPGMEEFIAEYTNEDTWGEDGYLADKGLISLSEEIQEDVAERANELVGITKEDLDDH